MARKLDAQFDGRYLMSSVLMTSTMKSDPATPPIRFISFSGMPVSAAMVRAVGGSAEGRRASAAGVAFTACGAAAPAAAPATATPFRKLRRSTLDDVDSFRAIRALPSQKNLLRRIERSAVSELEQV